MVPRGGHRLNEPVVGEVGGRGGRGPDPLHPETPPFSKRVPVELVHTATVAVAVFHAIFNLGTCPKEYLQKSVNCFTKT